MWASRRQDRDGCQLFSGGWLLRGPNRAGVWVGCVHPAATGIISLDWTVGRQNLGVSGQAWREVSYYWAVGHHLVGWNHMKLLILDHF